MTFTLRTKQRSGALTSNEVRFADAGLLNQLEPVGRGSVEGFALPRNQRGDDLVKDRNLIGESEFVSIGVVG